MGLVSEVLQDPEKMNQLSEMASALGVATDPQSHDLSIAADLPAVKQLTEMIRSAEAKETKHQHLIHALMPYLKPSRQMKLERAMQFSRLSRLAGTALQQYSHVTMEGADDHV